METDIMFSSNHILYNSNSTDAQNIMVECVDGGENSPISNLLNDNSIVVVHFMRL